MYRVVSHSEWADAHPGGCAVKETMPWSAEGGDELGKALWNASGGKVKFAAHELAMVRKAGGGQTDEEISRRFNDLIERENVRRKRGGWHGRWNSVPRRFLRLLRGQMRPDEAEKLGLPEEVLDPAYPKVPPAAAALSADLMRLSKDEVVFRRAQSLQLAKLLSGGTSASEIKKAFLHFRNMAASKERPEAAAQTFCEVASQLVAYERQPGDSPSGG